MRVRAKIACSSGKQYPPIGSQWIETTMRSPGFLRAMIWSATSNALASDIRQHVDPWSVPSCSPLNRDAARSRAEREDQKPAIVQIEHDRCASFTIIAPRAYRFDVELFEV